MEGYLKPTIFVCSQKEPDLKFFGDGGIITFITRLFLLRFLKKFGWFKDVFKTQEEFFSVCVRKSFTEGEKEVENLFVSF